MSSLELDIKRLIVTAPILDIRGCVENRCQPAIHVIEVIIIRGSVKRV